MSPRITNTLRWFFYEPRHFWLCVSVCLAAACVVIIGGGGAEPVVRIAGLVLQILGIVTVVWGIVETRDFFGMLSPYRAFIEWAARCPLRRRVITGSMSASLSSGSALSARGYTSWPIDASAPIEARISALERNLPLIQERITNFQAEFDRTARSLKDALHSEQQHRQQLSLELRGHLKSYGTGGLHVSAIGAAWVFLGTVFSTASAEVAAFLR